MKIKKIQIKKFKRFHDLTIDLGENPKRIVALVGPNGCGKSSVFDAIMYVVNSFSKCGKYDSRTKDYKYCSLDGTDTINYRNINIELDKGKYIDVRTARNKLANDHCMISFRGPYRYNSNVDIKILEAVSPIATNDYGASNTSLIDDKMVDNYKRLYNRYNKYLREKDKKPTEAMADIVGELNCSIKRCLNLELADLGNIGSSEGTIYFKKTDTARRFDFNVLSAGEKEVIDILLDLYLRQDDYNDTVFLIDEPELHLNTSIQRKLLYEINNLIGENCQIWIATHSIGFLRGLQDDFKEDTQIIRFDEKNEWASKEYILKPEKMNRNIWKSLFETALDDLTNLISPRKIIYCEGKDKPGLNGKEKGTDAIVYNTIFGEKYPDTVFVSSGGNTELEQRQEIAILILGKVFKELEILILRDRDIDSGKEATEEDRQEYLKKSPQNHRILKRFELENYLYDKEVLKKYCLNKELYFNEKEYNLLVSDIVNQNVKNDTSKIKEICSIKSLNSEKFKMQLAEYITEDMEVYKELEDSIFNRK